MRTAMRAATLAAVLATGACHYYADSSGSAVTPGTPVRLGLDQPETVDFTDAALRDIVAVEGPLLAWTPDSVLVSSDWVVNQRGSRNKTLGEPVRVSTVRVAVVEEQKVHRGRTAALIAGGGLVVGGLFLALFAREDANGSPGSGSGAGSGAGALVAR